MQILDCCLRHKINVITHKKRKPKKNSEKKKEKVVNNNIKSIKKK